MTEEEIKDTKLIKESNCIDLVKLSVTDCFRTKENGLTDVDDLFFLKCLNKQL